jgi:hypothetical protein
VLVPQVDGSRADTADRHEERFGASPEPFHVHLGWPSGDPSVSVGFVWRTDVDTLASVVEWGEGEALDQRAEGASFLFGGSAGDENRVHEAHLCGLLKPGTTYSYRVGGEGHFSPVYSFTTPGAPGSFDRYRLALVGDSRGAYATWGTLLASIDAADPDLILFSGDMVELGPSQGEWDAWFDASGDVLARRPFLPAHGNHEFLAVNYFAQFLLPGVEEWYTFRYGDLTVVSLNDTVRDYQVIESDQIRLMDEAFAASPDDWKLAMHHRPVYSTCTRHGSDEVLRSLWEPVFDRHGVDLVVAGHNHIYERSVPIRAGQEVAAGQGTTYLVAGGAGAPLYEESEAEWFGVVAQPTEHWVQVDVSPRAMDFVVRDLSGAVIDEFSIPR